MATPARRGHGEGSVYRDAANGTWVGAISLSWRPDGARIRRKVTGRTKTDLLTEPDHAPQGPGLGCPRRHRALLVGTAPGRDPAAPKPEITPSAKILQLAAEQDIELEADG